LLPSLEGYYKATYGKSLDATLKSETSGHFGRLLRMCVKNEFIVAANTLYHAMKGVGCDVPTCGETLVGRSNWEIQGIKYEYKALYNEDLEKRLVKETGGDVEKFFVAILQALRDDSSQIGDIAGDIAVLYKAGQAKMIGCDEGEFIRIFLTRNYTHLTKLFNDYSQKHGITMVKLVEKKFSGKLEKIMLHVVNSIMDRTSFFSELLHSSMAGLGMDEGNNIV
jgi:annexin A7/11